jgi:hypothetical protein
VGDWGPGRGGGRPAYICKGGSELILVGLPQPLTSMVGVAAGVERSTAAMLVSVLLIAAGTAVALCCALLRGGELRGMGILGVISYRWTCPPGPQ